MTGIPSALALSTTPRAAPLWSTSSMTPQPLVSCWSAIVAYLSLSPWAFWTSASNPAASSPSWRYLRSRSSQRFEDTESGRITHARPASAAPLSLGVPPPELEQPASRTTAALASAAAARSDDFLIIRLSSFVIELREAPPRGLSGLEAIILRFTSWRQDMNVTLWQRRDWVRPVNAPRRASASPEASDRLGATGRR